MSEVVYGRLSRRLLPQMREFCRVNWGGEHPLIHDEKMFDFYYKEGILLNFVVAYTPETDAEVDFLRADKIKLKPIEIQGVCGFIKTNSGEHPDVFISYILTKKGTQFGFALKMIEKVQSLTGARTLSCNNIRKKTRGIYDFLNYTVDDMTQWYRLNDGIENYTLCDIPFPHHEQVRSAEIEAVEVTSPLQLNDFPFSDFSEDLPYKDEGYVTKRYLTYPWHPYLLFRLSDAGRSALIVLREIEWENSRMLRIVDFIGDRSLIKDCGNFIDELLKTRKAEFADWYSFGVTDADMSHAGFSIRYSDDKNILPMYFSPLLMSNVEITIFTNSQDGFMMFRADGDQDRPNLG